MKRKNKKDDNPRGLRHINKPDEKNENETRA